MRREQLYYGVAVLIIGGNSPIVTAMRYIAARGGNHRCRHFSAVAMNDVLRMNRFAGFPVSCNTGRHGVFWCYGAGDAFDIFAPEKVFLMSFDSAFADLISMTTR